MTGLEFRTWRREHGLTQVELAHLLEVHAITISNWERSRYAIPRWVPRLLTILERSYERRARHHPGRKRNAPALQTQQGEGVSA